MEVIVKNEEIEDILKYLDEELHPVVSPDNNYYLYSNLHDMVSKLLNNEKLIRCEDCRHYMPYSKGSRYGECENEFVWDLIRGETTEVSGIDVDGNFCCYYAERRKDG